MMDDKEMFIKIAKKYGAKENDGQGLRIIMPDGEIKPLTEEIMREILFPFIPDLNIPFVTGMSTDADKPIPESETWSDDPKHIEVKIKYGEKNLVDFTKLRYNEEYPFTDDGRHYRVAYDGITKEYADEERQEVRCNTCEYHFGQTGCNAKYPCGDYDWSSYAQVKE